MDHFQSRNSTIAQISKGLNLTKSLFVSSILIGEAHTGKKSFIRSLFADLPQVDAADAELLKESLERFDALVIFNFEKIPDPASLPLEEKRIVATANKMPNLKSIDELFAFIYTMPPLRERPEDIPLLQEYFLHEACDTLELDPKAFSPSDLPADLSDNTRSLRRGIYYTLVSKSMDKTQIMQTLFDYFLAHLEGKNGYKETLEIYEKPLIEAGLKRYGSQLKLSEVLGINRNTLRKKIHEHGID